MSSTACLERSAERAFPIRDARSCGPRRSTTRRQSSACQCVSSPLAHRFNSAGRYTTYPSNTADTVVASLSTRSASAGLPRYAFRSSGAASRSSSASVHFRRSGSYAFASSLGPSERPPRTCSIRARGKGKDGLLQMPRRSARASVSHRSMPRLWTTIASCSNGPSGASATSDASASARFSVRLLRMSLMRSARRKLSLQVLHTSAERDLKQLSPSPGFDRGAREPAVRKPAHDRASIRMRLASENAQVV